mmetsp:Transcript_12218/g.20119  ORF Transcript_12218/g.20119 Transcript_12218/m.20119 type:complete len:164 (-) Transcript_12218:3487-3978(-)|eukprot:scaffold2532_cov79-Skeletonema_menzelii.AAC.3
MSWTQVYVTGLARAINPSDEEIEAYLCKRYSLAVTADDSNSGDDAAGNIMWAGEGSTLIKRDESGCCRGFAFLTFLSVDGAMMIIDRINNGNSEESDNGGDHMTLRAELSNPKGGTKKKSNKKNNDDNLPDLRLRRQRKLPVRKHPVITSSDGKRTNLGNKTK